MIIAIFGGSSVGKTSLARLLARTLSCPLRSCGDAVREAATKHGTTPDRLSDELHQAVDNATRAWVLRQSTSRGGLVEGRFLDHVLAPIADMVQAVKMVASPEVRAARWATRLDQSSGECEMLRQDRLDEVFCAQMYGLSSALQPRLVVDSTARTPEECAAWLEQHLPRERP